MNWLIPLARNVSGSEVEDFLKSGFRFEDLPRFCDFADLPVESLDRVGGVDEPPEIVAVDEVGR